MLTKAFNRLLSQLDKLTPEQSKNIVIKLSKEQDNLEETIGTVACCPHCQSKRFHKWGIRSNIQRYRCKECTKTFNALTNTPLSRLRHKEVWKDYANDLINGLSLRASAKHCNVDKNTTFRWRHRMLQIPKDMKVKLHGIVEFDETYFLESHKGERDLNKPRKRGGKAKKRGVSKEQTAVMIIRDRNGNTDDAILKKSDKETITKVMKPLLDKDDVLLCSDSKPSYIAFSKSEHFKHETINLANKEYVKDGIYHVQNVNAYDSRLKRWISHFHGVATKYLDSYLGWMRLLDREKEITVNQLLGIISGKSLRYQPLTST
jgi:transposase-like protein